MEIKESTISFQIKQYFQDCLHSYKIIDKKNILVSHCGTFSQDFINSLVVGNEELMHSSGDKKTLVKRVFSILIEGLQNIRIHGEVDELNDQIAYMMIAKDSESYKINLGNIIKSSKIDQISTQISKLNTLSLEEVKILYNKVLTEEMFSEKGGAGLGFIIMRMKSGNLLNFKILPLSESKSFFSVEILLDRSI
jgi:hypothetical protein